MNFLALSGLANFVACISLGLLVFLKNPANSRVNRDYFYFNIAIALYSFGYFMWQFLPAKRAAEMWFYVLFDGITVIQVMYLRFVFSFLGITEQKNRLLTLIAILCGLFVLLNHGGFLYGNFQPRDSMGLWPTPTPLFVAYLVFWHFTCFYGFFALIISIRSTTGIKSQQIKLVAIACGIGYLGGATNWPVWYGARFIPYPNILIAVYVGVIAYAILRHRLMDFNLLLRLGLAYFFAFVLLAALALTVVKMANWLSTQVFKMEPGLVLVMLICVISLISNPLRRLASRLADQFVFQSPDYKSIIGGIEVAIAGKAEPEILAENLTSQLKNLYQLDHAGVALWNFQQSVFLLLPFNEFQTSTLEMFGDRINQTDFLVRTLETERRLFMDGVVSQEEVTTLGNKASAGERATFWKIRRTMRWLRADVCVPVMKGARILGFIILGEKRNKSTYSHEDRKFLSHVAEVVSEPVSNSLHLIGGSI